MVSVVHLRYSTCLGLSVVEEESQLPLGSVGGILIHPDTGKVEGFFVNVGGFFTSARLFLSVSDIRSFGMRIAVRSAEMLSPLEERIRLRALHAEGRPVLGQMMVTEGGCMLGRCADVQFDTRFFMVEWLFPRRWFRSGVPVAISAVLEVRRDAVVIRDQGASEEEIQESDPVALHRPMQLPLTQSGMEPH